MNILFEQLIADFHERTLPVLTPRETRLPALPGKIDAVLGMRRSGKTSFLFQAMRGLLDRGVAKERMLYINFDDDRLLPMTTEDLGSIGDAYFRMFPDHKSQICYFFFDEIQNVAGWETYLRRLLDTEQVQLAVTGSSAKLLSREIATSLRGRAISTEIFPFSFRESLTHEGIDPGQQRPGSSKRAVLENRLRRYLIVGGFPEVQGIADEYRIRMLQEYVDAVVLRDIVERHRVGNILPLRYLIRHLLAAAARLFSINKFYNDLKSQGIACSKDTLRNYFEWLEDAYLVCSVPIETRSERVRQTNPRKVYAIDTGLLRAFSHSPRSDQGHLLECFVFMALRRKGVNIAYYRTKQGYEVDFITTSLSGEVALYQVALHLRDESTRKREVRALTDAMEETGLKHGVIITLEQEEVLSTPFGRIDIQPAWQFAMNAMREEIQ